MNRKKYENSEHCCVEGLVYAYWVVMVVSMLGVSLMDCVYAPV